jgi:hypothetical protein
MRTPQLISDFLDWRWAPSVGLTAGSLAFVGLALLLIPTELGSAPARVDNGSTPFVAAAPTAPQKRALFSSAIAGGVADRIGRISEPAAGSTDQAAPVARGFSPVADRPEPVPPPVAQPVQAMPPAPEPGSVTIIQHEPDGPSREVTNP